MWRVCVCVYVCSWYRLLVLSLFLSLYLSFLFFFFLFAILFCSCRFKILPSLKRCTPKNVNYERATAYNERWFIFILIYLFTFVIYFISLLFFFIFVIFFPSVFFLESSSLLFPTFSFSPVPRVARVIPAISTEPLAEVFGSVLLARSNDRTRLVHRRPEIRSYSVSFRFDRRFKRGIKLLRRIFRNVLSTRRRIVDQSKI